MHSTDVQDDHLDFLVCFALLCIALTWLDSSFLIHRDLQSQKVKFIFPLISRLVLVTTFAMSANSSSSSSSYTCVFFLRNTKSISPSICLLQKQQQQQVALFVQASKLSKQREREREKTPRATKPIAAQRIRFNMNVWCWMIQHDCAFCCSSCNLEGGQLNWRWPERGRDILPLKLACILALSLNVFVCIGVKEFGNRQIGLDG